MIKNTFFEKIEMNKIMNFRIMDRQNNNNNRVMTALRQ